jgi:hypothetical protein
MKSLIIIIFIFQMDAPTLTPMVIGTGTPTPAPTLSVPASCYPSSPIDSSIGIDESVDIESDSDELETDTQGIRCAGRGGRPPLLQNKRERNVRKKSIVCQHFTKDLESPTDKPVARCNYCRLEYKCHGKSNGISNMLYHVKAYQQYKALLANQDASQSKFTFESVPSEGDGGTGSCNFESLFFI